MRNAFADELMKVAERDSRVVFLSGDIGNRLFDTFKATYPARFLNCGVAEANMTGMAAGMAMCGLRPVTYTITPFNTTRCLEQIRVDVCYHHQPVTIVGVGGGLAYAELGATHHSCEDIAFLRALPGMSVICPGDPVEVRLALRAAAKQDGPVYIRIGKRGEPVVHQTTPAFTLGKALPLRAGRDLCLLSTGNVLPTVVAVAQALEEKGFSAAAVSFHTVKPLDEAFLEEAFATYPLVVTVEEHSLVGGFGAAVAEWRADHPEKLGRAAFVRVGTRDEFLHEAGDEHYAREYFGLTRDAIVERVLGSLDVGHAKIH